MTAIDSPHRLVQAAINQLKQEKIEAVGRYLHPHNPDKALGAAESLAIRKAGLKLFSIWQTDAAGHTYFTEEQGGKDAQNAVRLAAEAGQPPGSPIFFRVDYDALPADHAAVISYFSSVRRMIRDYAVGVSGSYDIIELLASAGQADFFYQTSAWSSGKLSQKTHIYLLGRGTGTAETGNGSVRILRPGVFWDSPFKSQPTPKKDCRRSSENKASAISELMETIYRAAGYPLSQADLHSTLQTIEQNGHQNSAFSSRSRRYPGRLIRLGSKGRPVRYIQEAVGIPVDGVYGPKTKAAVESYQRRCRLYPDGIVGPITWRLLLKVLLFLYSLPYTFVFSYD